MKKSGRYCPPRMRIKDIPGWPPQRFQAAKVDGNYSPPVRSLVFIENVGLVPGAELDADCEILLLLEDRATRQLCSTQLKLKSAKQALNVVRTLAKCRGLSLSAVGDVKVTSENRALTPARD
jgi:hypothetical protein